VNRQDAKISRELEREEPNAALDALVHRVIGAAIEVHRHLGPGFLESLYEEALCVELTLRGIRFARQVPIAVQYKQKRVGEARLDLLVDDSVVVELKACECIAPIHVAQTLSYLKSTRLRLALLINFDVAVLQRGIKRIIHTHENLGALGALAVDFSQTLIHFRHGLRCY
jgi:GxxExxY protein